MTAPASERTKRKALRLWANGMPRADIADVVGVCKETISGWAREAGLPSRKRGHSDAVRQRALKLYKRGLPASEIVRMTGLRWNVIRDWARAAGMPPRMGGAPAHRYSDAARKRALELYSNSHWSVREIAEVIGANEITIVRWARQADLPRRHSPGNRWNKHDDAKRARAMEMYAAGRRVVEISDLLGIPKPTIWSWAKVDHPGRVPKVDANEVGGLYKRFRSRKDVAEILGISLRTVDRALQNYTGSLLDARA